MADRVWCPFCMKKYVYIKTLANYINCQAFINKNRKDFNASLEMSALIIADISTKFHLTVKELEDYAIKNHSDKGFDVKLDLNREEFNKLCDCGDEK